MTPVATSRLPQVLERREAEILAQWNREQLAGGTARSGLLSEAEFTDHARDFLSRVRQATARGSLAELDGQELIVRRATP